MWISLITSLPSDNATARMRAWRALKSSGAAVLRDGVYLLPDTEACVQALRRVADELQTAGGSAYLAKLDSAEGFVEWFDRSADYAALQAEIAAVRTALTVETAAAAVKHARKLRKALAAVVAVDFFPAAPRQSAEAALRDLELAAAGAASPDEPQAVAHAIEVRQVADYQGRRWATRRRPWVDRLASAWLIGRFIDAQPRWLWLAAPADCPADALGFDFDGATFSHVGERVTFEVLLASFGLADLGLARLALLVHGLDVGGVLPPEAAGVERVLAGLRSSIADDDQLLASALPVFDGLYAAFAAGADA